MWLKSLSGITLGYIPATTDANSAGVFAPKLSMRDHFDQLPSSLILRHTSPSTIDVKS